MSIELQEYAQRRASVLEQLEGAAAVVLAGSGAPPLVGRWRADSNFVYLTGIRDEPEALVLFDPTHPEPKRRVVLFLKPRNPEMEDWDGRREPIAAALREKTGFETVLRTTHLPRALSDAARRAGAVACLHPPASYAQPVSADLALYRKLAERIPGLSIRERSQILPSMRAVKSEAERGLMRRAIEATLEGYRALGAALQPGVGERDLQRAFVRGIQDAGADGFAYNPIVGAGPNATVLHYIANDATVGEDQLLVIDAGAEVEGYAADITRTFPSSGKFTARQREIYGIVLEAQQAAIEAVGPGATIWDADRAAREVIDKAGFGDHFIHGIGHQLGIEVHDATPDGALRAGHVITIEPGVYLPEEGLGVRIEDDILVTPEGNTNLSAAIPNRLDEVEMFLAAARDGRRGE